MILKLPLPRNHLFDSFPNHCLWWTLRKPPGRYPSPCSLFLFLLVVPHLCCRDNWHLWNNKRLQNVHVLRILNKFCLWPDKVVDGLDYIDFHILNIYWDLCFVVVDIVDPLCFVIHVDMIDRENFPGLVDYFGHFVGFVGHVYWRNLLVFVLGSWLFALRSDLLPCAAVFNSFFTSDGVFISFLRRTCLG